MRSALLLAVPLHLVAGALPLSAQEVQTAEQVADGFFQGRNWAPSEAISSCPGIDPMNDAIVAALVRPRPESQTRELTNRWGIVPDCRVDQILAWCAQATRVLTNGPSAASLARLAEQLDSERGLRVVRAAAVDAVVPPEARGAYQLAAFPDLSPDDQADLYIETFRLGLQEGVYQGVGLRYAFDGPDPTGTAIRLLSAVLEDDGNPRAHDVFGRVMGVVTGLERFGPDDHSRVWAFFEGHLASASPAMREAILSYEAELRPGW